jgi:hypothetical protein
MNPYEWSPPPRSDQPTDPPSSWSGSALRSDLLWAVLGYRLVRSFDLVQPLPEVGSEERGPMLAYVASAAWAEGYAAYWSKQTVQKPEKSDLSVRFYVAAAARGWSEAKLDDLLGRGPERQLRQDDGRLVEAIKALEEVGKMRETIKGMEEEMARLQGEMAKLKAEGGAP